MATKTIADGPGAIEIGTRRVFQNDMQYKYTKIKVGDETCYMCSTPTETGKAGEFLILRYEAPNYVAYEGCSGQDGMLQMRQPCFKSDEVVWEAGDHGWYINESRSTTATEDTPVVWSAEKMYCATKIPSA